VEPTESAPDAASVRRDVDRLVAFSDGVFAIAITLLVLNIQVPDVSDENLGDAVSDLVPELFTYALSFVVVGLYWISHHQMFRALQRVDRSLLWLNLALLGFVALLPFPTELLGTYGDTSLATVIYAAAIIAVGSTAAVLWWYINRAGLTARISADLVRMGLLRIAIAPAVFALSIPIALVAPGEAKITWLLIWPANIVLERWHARTQSAP
jgi:uncharacterized membrane protein